MDYLVANLAGRVRREKHQGRDYLVAPLSMIVPGVLNGSDGPLYYSPEETSRNVGAWNGIPITVGHPTENGRAVSARIPRVADKFAIGTVYEAVYNEKLSAEGWFDVERTRSVCPEILNALEAGTPIELSTGLRVDKEPVANGATFNGTAYVAKATNYKPDHLAVLIDQKGACSLQDGCGVLVNGERKPIVLNEEERQSLISQIQSWYTNVTEWLTNAQPRSSNSGKFKPYGAGTGKGDIHEAAQGGGVSVSDRQATLGQDAKDQKEAGHNPPNWVVDEATWEKAKTAAEKSGNAENWPVIVSIYESMGGTISGTNNENSEDGQVGSSDSVISSNEEPTMAKLTSDQRKKIVDDLIGNCCAGDESPWSEGDRETLNKFSDETLTSMNKTRETLISNARIVEAAQKGFKDDSVEIVYNADKGQFMKKDAPADGEDPNADPNADPNKEKKPMPPTGNAKPKTTAEWLKEAPQEIRDAVTFARNEEAKQRKHFTDSITANAEGLFTSEELAGKSLEELAKLSQFVKNAKGATEEETPAPVYFGSAPVTNRRKEEVGNDILPLPVMNFSSEKTA